MTVWRGAGLVAGLALVGGLVAGCQGADPGTEEQTGGGTSVVTAAPDTGTDTGAATSSDAPGDDPLGAAQPLPEPTLTATGTVPTIDGDVEAGVVSVEEVGGQTRVVWALRSADGADLTVDYMNGLAGERATTDDVRAAVLELGDGTRLQTLLTGTDEDGTVVALGCLCSRMPSVVTGTWTVLSSSFPPLPEGTDQVTLRLPGPDGDDSGISLTGLPAEDG